MTPQEEQLLKARKELVVKYRQSPHPWPDGIDSKWDRWYIAEEWDDDGTYHGITPMPKRPEVSVDNGVVDNLSVDKNVDKSRTEYYREQKRKQRAAQKALRDAGTDRNC